jgi:hypothetical protein
MNLMTSVREIILVRATKLLKVTNLFSFSLLVYERYISESVFAFLVLMFSQWAVLDVKGRGGKEEEEEERRRGSERRTES